MLPINRIPRPTRTSKERSSLTDDNVSSNVSSTVTLLHSNRTPSPRATTASIPVTGTTSATRALRSAAALLDPTLVPGHEEYSAPLRRRGIDLGARPPPTITPSASVVSLSSIGSIGQPAVVLEQTVAPSAVAPSAAAEFGAQHARAIALADEHRARASRHRTSMDSYCSEASSEQQQVVVQPRWKTLFRRGGA